MSVTPQRQRVLAWHFLQSDGYLGLLHHGKRIKPRARQTLRYNGPLSLCKSGLHASVDLLDALTYSPGNVICRVQCGGKIIHGDDKLVCSERKILWKLDATRTIRTLHEFNLWCTDQVLRAERKAGRKPDKCLLEAIKLKRKWLDNKSVETELDEAINKVYALADQICRRSSQPYSARLRAVHIVYLTCRKYAPVIRVLLMQEATKLTRKDLSAKLEQMLTKAAGK